MRVVIISAFSFLFTASLFAQKFELEIKSLSGEKWYVAYTTKAFCNTPLEDLTVQSYQENKKPKYLNVDNSGNQTASFLVSHFGRYVWSDVPFDFELKNGNLLLFSDVEIIEAEVGGKSLHEGYLSAQTKHFPASGKTPHELLFKIPKFNTCIELGHNQNQKDVIKYADDVLKNNFLAGVFMIDYNWSHYYWNYEFGSSIFLDTKGMKEYLHGKGFKVMLRDVASLHTKKGDYIYVLAQKASKDGEAIVRHLEYAFTNQDFASCDDQFMLGEKYLMASMIETGNSRNVKLPKGLWMDDLGKKYKGGNTNEIGCLKRFSAHQYRNAIGWNYRGL